MSIEGILIGLLAILIGVAWTFWGLQLFFILLPIWAFFIGLIAGADFAQEILGESFLGTVTSWIIGIVVGLVLAVLSYFWYYGAVILLGATVGYTLGAGLMGALGFEGVLSIVVGLIVAALVAIVVVVLAVPAMLVILLTAIGGAAAAVNGALILLGRIQVNDIDAGLTQGLLTDGLLAVVAWIVLAAAGIYYQTRTAATMAAGVAAIDRSRYRVA